MNKDEKVQCLLRGEKACNYKYGLGGEIGVKVHDNIWVSTGYNIVGFEDKDFDEHGYLKEGFFFRFRMSIDENMFSIGKRKN